MLKWMALGIDAFSRKGVGHSMRVDNCPERQHLQIRMHFYWARSICSSCYHSPAAPWWGPWPGSRPAVPAAPVRVPSRSSSPSWSGRPGPGCSSRSAPRSRRSRSGWSRRLCRATRSWCLGGRLWSAGGTPAGRSSCSRGRPGSGKGSGGCWCVLLRPCSPRILCAIVRGGFRACGLRKVRWSLPCGSAQPANRQHWPHRESCWRGDRHWRCILLSRLLCCFRRVAARSQWSGCEGFLLPSS